jgi:dTDP-4-amino-4,6-dideoxygalactose transaminase
MINVTKTYLPPLEKYNALLEQIWASGWVTNHGPMVLELEQKLKDYLGVKHLFFVNNGTIALQIAIKALDLKGEIITTPFSYVATTSCIVWENCKPVFVDIDSKTFTINPDLIEEAITPETTAILATHVYGIPCHVEKIEKIAKRNNLKVIYDAAHSFGAEYNYKSLASYGDISTLSFHATKIFHTVEGGAVITNDDELAHKISYMRNFGHKGQEDFWGLGVNGKNCELHAAMGLCILPEMNKIISKRKELSDYYNELLDGMDLVRPQCDTGKFHYNYAYFPVVFPSEEILLKVKDELNKQDIFPRRYFYPSLNNLNYIDNVEMTVTDEISPCILCLPLYNDLRLPEVEKITDIISKALKYELSKINSNGIFE